MSLFFSSSSPLLYSLFYSASRSLREGPAAAAAARQARRFACLLACLQASYGGDAIADGAQGNPARSIPSIPSRLALPLSLLWGVRLLAGPRCRPRGSTPRSPLSPVPAFNSRLKFPGPASQGPPLKRFPHLPHSAFTTSIYGRRRCPLWLNTKGALSPFLLTTLYNQGWGAWHF